MSTIASYKKALTRERKDLRAWRALGRIYVHKKKYKEALGVYRRGLLYAGLRDRHFFYNGMGNAYRMMGRRPGGRLYSRKALVVYRRALRLAPQGLAGIYWSNISVVYAALNKWNDALYAARTALAHLTREERQGMSHGKLIPRVKKEVQVFKKRARIQKAQR